MLLKDRMQMLGEKIVKHKKVRMKREERDRWFSTDTTTAEGSIIKLFVPTSLPSVLTTPFSTNLT
jgi:hypothetical protein